MRFNLRDRDRIWSMAAGPGIHPGRAGAVDFPASLGVLSGLIHDAGNRDMVREALSSAYPREPRPVPADSAALLRDLEARLRTREWILFVGSPTDWIEGGRMGGSSGRPGMPAAPEEPEEAVPLFEPDRTWEKAWTLAAVELGETECGPSEGAGAPMDTPWEMAAVELAEDEIAPVGVSPGTDPADAWELEAVFLGDDEMAPGTEAPESGAAGGPWEIADVVLEEEEIAPGNKTPGG